MTPSDVVSAPVNPEQARSAKARALLQMQSAYGTVMYVRQGEPDEDFYFGVEPDTLPRNGWVNSLLRIAGCNPITETSPAPLFYLLLALSVEDSNVLVRNLYTIRTDWRRDLNMRSRVIGRIEDYWKQVKESNFGKDTEVTSGEMAIVEDAKEAFSATGWLP
ncbi:MAG: hypothetical protein PHG63_02425 [Candidatus Dojkabacteria bacterium]|nr:hypothetical protein [Candidatus Dojkabacteria bacterium]